MSVLCLSYVVVSQNKGTPISTQNTIVLIMGIPKMVPLILGNPHFTMQIRLCHEAGRAAESLGGGLVRITMTMSLGAGTPHGVLEGSM